MIGAGYAYGQIASVFDVASQWRVSLFAMMGVSGLAATFLFPNVKTPLRSICALWLPALLLRLVLLPVAPSDDINRYLWEGKLVREGISPYAQLANAPELVVYRDSYWDAMNHKDQLTAYPPIIVGLFAVIGAIVYHPLAYKIVFILGDLTTLAGILFLLRRRGLGLWYSGFYALSPIVALSYAGEGHFDSWMIAALVWAVCCVEKQYYKSAVLIGSIATGIKFITAPIIPFLIGRHFVSGALITVVGLLIPALFFWDSLMQLFNGFVQFGGTRSFNGPIYELLFRGFSIPRGVCSAFIVFCFSGIILWRWVLRNQSPLDSHIRWILGGLLVLSPTVHFWYIAWILPFVCLRPSLPWLTFSVVGGAYFWVWTNVQTELGWGLSPLQILCFWIPFFIACSYEVWSTRGRVLFPQSRIVEKGIETISVIIPTLNAAKDLPIALKSLYGQTESAMEILVIDAGSTDETLAVAAQSQCSLRVLQSEPGRGIQIAFGVSEAKGDWVVILHSDSVLNATSLETLRKAIDSDIQILGGALGQRFSGERAELVPIEVLNDFRGLFTRTAFGDQVQFFHRETALQHYIMPAQPLMEDVESSWRLRELGGFCFLGCPTVVSHRKWKAEDWLKRFKLVMSLVSRYRFARMKGRAYAEKLSQSLYDEYYPSKKPNSQSD